MRVLEDDLCFGTLALYIRRSGNVKAEVNIRLLRTVRRECHLAMHNEYEW